MEKAQRLTVLFIAMEFPPANTTGMYRSLKFVKYLHEFGIDPVVVTFKEDQGMGGANAKVDRLLLNEIPGNTSVYRIERNCKMTDSTGSRSRDFFKMLFRKNDNLAKSWAPFLCKEIGFLIEKHNPQLVFTSLPPFSSGALVMKVAEKYKLPMVTDMRDLWARWGNAAFMTIAHYWLTFYEEKSVFKKSSQVIGVTPQVIEQFLKSHPELDKDKFHFIPNGFDFPVEQLRDFEFVPGKKIIIGYVGSFYYSPEHRDNSFKPWWKRKGHKMLQFYPTKEDWRYRSPYFFFKIIKKLLQDFPELQNVIELHFVGHKPGWFDTMVSGFSLSGNVFSYGFVSSARAAEIQQNFDLVLATSEKVIGKDHYCLPSKIFDYVGKEKPIVGVVTNGIQKDFIEKSGLGVICDPDNETQSVAALHDLVVNGKKFTVNKGYLASYHRKNIAKKLADVFLSIRK